MSTKRHEIAVAQDAARRAAYAASPAGRAKAAEQARIAQNVEADIAARATLGFVPEEGAGVNVRGQAVHKSGKASLTVGLSIRSDGTGARIP